MRHNHALCIQTARDMFAHAERVRELKRQGERRIRLYWTPAGLNKRIGRMEKYHPEIDGNTLAEYSERLREMIEESEKKNV